MKIVAIDDELERKKNLPSQEDVLFIQITDDSSLVSAQSTLGEIGEDIFVILDLGFTTLDPIAKNQKAMLQSLEKLFDGHFALTVSPSTNAIELSGASFRADVSSQPEAIQPSLLGGISLLPTLFSLATAQRKVGVMIATSRGGLPGVLGLAAGLNDMAKAKGILFQCEQAEHGRSLSAESSANRIFESIPKVWARWFPSYHAIGSVNRSIEVWLNYYDELERIGCGEHFCQHNGAAKAIEEDWENYKKLLASCFGIDQCQLPESLVANHIKAVFDLDVKPDLFSPKKTFRVNVGAFPGYCAKRIPRELMSTLLRHVSSLEVVSSGDLDFNLPCQPGFPFLVSIQALVQRMSEENGLLDRYGQIHLHVTHKGPNRISIPMLAKPPNGHPAIADSWVRKIRDFSVEIENPAKYGVCPALWDLLCGRIRGLKPDLEANEIKRRLLTLFEGPGGLVAGVAFTPKYIHIHW